MKIAEKTNKDINEVSLNDVLNAEDGSILELVCGNILDKVELAKRDELLDLLLSKIHYNGHIILSGIDIRDISRKYDIGEIDIDRYLTKVYSVRSASYLESLLKKIKDKKYYVIISRLDSNLM